MVPDNLVATGPWDTLDYTYDSAGNVISDNRLGDIYTYTYNAANRLSSVSLNGVLQAEYKYNVLGQQVWRKLSPSGQIIHSLFDLDGNRIAEYDYDAVADTSTLIREYIWLDGRPVAVVEGGVTYYVRVDHIGRPVFATDSTGAIVWQAKYLPFGGVQATTGTPMELRFPGQWFQSESGLHQNWMRDYDPTTGRYMQADPLGLVDGASVYSYVRQNPGRYVDPRGEFGVPGAIAGAIAGGVAGYITTDCLTGAIAGAAVGGVVGATGGAIALPVESTMLGGGLGSAMGQIIANEIAEYDCSCTRPIPFSDLITSPQFWTTSAGGAVGAGVGSLAGGRLSGLLSRKLFGHPALRNPSRNYGENVLSTLITEGAGGGAAAIGEYGGSYPWR